MAAIDSSKVPGGWLGLWLGILVTAGLAAAVVVAWPEDEARVLAATEPLTPTTRYGAGVALPSDLLDQLSPTDPNSGAAVSHLFTAGLPEAVAAVLAAAGDPTELHELAVYPTYAFVTYRDPADPGALVRSLWRDGTVTLESPSAPRPVDEAELFSAAEVDLGRIASLVADAPAHYPVPVTVTHVLIDRFLPFDERVLVRVYASPPGDPSGGGYVSYTADGSLVDVCCQ